MELDQIAGLSAWLAIPSLFLATLFGALFFLEKGERFGPLNDIAFAAVLFFLILPAIAVNDRGITEAVWFGIVTWLAVVGMIGAGIGQLLLVRGVISLRTSFLTGGVGIVPVLAWMAALPYLSLRHGEPSQLAGWAMLVSLALIVALFPLLRAGRKTMVVVASVVTLSLIIWLFDLGHYLMSVS